jgi:hypothetical protein
MKTLLLASLLLSGACYDAHMGDLYGRRSRAAFDAQQGGKGEAAAFDAVDARTASQRYHSAPTQGGGQQAAPTLSIPLTGSYGGSSGSSTMGVTPSGPPAGGVRLDAVR